MDPNQPSFQNIERLPEALQDIIRKYYFEKFKQECGNDLELGLNSGKVRSYIDEHCTDIGFRLGLSMARTAEGKEGLEAEYLEHYANISVMKRTLEVPGEEQINNLKQQIRSELGQEATSSRVNELCQEQLKKNQGVQMELITQLLPDQLGNNYIKLEDGKRIEYTGSVSELYARGERTTVIFPGSKDAAELFSTIMLEDAQGKEMVVSPLSARGWATHSADLSIKGDGIPQKK